MTKRRCFICKYKLNVMTEFECKCKHYFCSKHRLPIDHNCSIDYRKKYKELLEKKNKKIEIEKVIKI